MQPHLIKCFDAVKRLQFGEGDDSKKMLALISAEAEKVPFTTPPMAEGAVEMWLMAMQNNMQSTIYDQCKACLQELGTAAPNWLPGGVIPNPETKMWDPLEPLDNWYFGYLAAAIIMIGQIEWTGGVTGALVAMKDGTNANAMKEFQEGGLRMCMGPL